MTALRKSIIIGVTVALGCVLVHCAIVWNRSDGTEAEKPGDGSVLPRGAEDEGHFPTNDGEGSGHEGGKRLEADDESRRGEESAHRETSKKRPYKPLVEKLSRLSVEDRIRHYLEMAQQLDVFRKYDPWRKGDLHVLVLELALQRDFDVLEALGTIPEEIERKKAVWIVLSRWSSHELWKDPDSVDGRRAKALLEDWALANPDCIELARFHPNGLDILLSKLEDSEVWPPLRAQCAGMIGDMGDASLVPRLRAFVGDKTLVYEPSAKEGRTLGQIVEDCIDRLQSKGGE